MTLKQLHYFFELCDKLNIDKKFAEEQAKERCGMKQEEKFSMLTTQQISPLIIAMEKELKTAETPYRLGAPEITAHDGDFPNDFRVWDKVERKMYSSLELFSISPFLALRSWEPTAEPDRFHFMQFTGRLDDKGEKIYDNDFVDSVTGKRYIVQWSWKACGWVGYTVDTADKPEEELDLGFFGKIEKVGDVYTGVKE